MARLHSETIPTSTLAATARVVDGFVTTQTDHSGITGSFTRAFTATGITQIDTDGRGNITTTHTDLAGRSISSTDAAGNTTATVYDEDFDAPSVVTNAQGKTACYKYDLRGRKVAEWGTAIQSPRRLVGGLDKCAAFARRARSRGAAPSQPALFGYDDADNLTALTTFRADSGDITTDPSERTDGDTTTWVYHSAAGVELSKTYADNSQVVKTYDAFNRLATETNARGIVKTLSYDAATGQLTGISFSDEATPSQSFAYNILGQLTQVTDAAGTRSIAYNEYSEQQSDSLNSGAHTHLVTELRDSYGRSTGFTYARSGSTQFTTSVGYATDGRIATAGFMHGGVNRQFSYSYLSGSNLLHTLTQPNGLTLTQSYEEHRDLLTGMQYHRGSTLVVERSYSEDKAPDGRKGDWTNAQHLPEGRGAVGRLRVTLGRPTNRSTARQGSVKNDTFTHNDRSESARRPRLGRLRQQAVRAIGQTRSVCPEGARSREAAPSQLAAATLGTDAYSYSYDNIGNRKTAQEAAEEATAYDANNLNQYTSIQEGTAEAFVPTFDADGNQTKVKTSTGIWNVVYNAENRPVTFTSEDGATVVECTYDYMGRRHTRKITVNGSVTNYLRYIYRGYLQIAAINAVSGVFQWFILWDPTQPVATRPLGIRKDGTWYTYGWDLTKNICEVFSSGGTILTAYTYTPYGTVTANGNVTQPIQWSSEYNDSELGLVYYNYRHYNPSDGRWIRKDPLRGVIWERAYSYTDNNPYKRGDLLGLESFVPDTTPLSEEALAWVKSNCAWFKEVGDAFRFKEPELIAVATAMAEEYSQKNNPLHRAVDAVQDGVIKLTDLIIETSLQKFKIFGYELKPDVGPGNINVNTALKARHYTFNRRRLDLTREMRKILGEKEIARVLVDDRGSIVYGAAEMRRQIDQFNTFLKNKNVSIEQMTDHDLSQNLVDLWRQGDGRFSKMEATYNKKKGCYMPEHKHHGISLAEEKYNQIKDALKNCED